MDFPNNVKYSTDHERVRIYGELAYVCIPDYVKEQLGEKVFVYIQTACEHIETAKLLGTMGVVKSMAD